MEDTDEEEAADENGTSVDVLQGELPRTSVNW